MIALEMLARDLGAPDLTEEEAKRLFQNPECTELMHESAWLYYYQGHSGAQIARHQGCTRGPVVRRLRAWRERSRALLEGGR